MTPWEYPSLRSAFFTFLVVSEPAANLLTFPPLQGVDEGPDGLKLISDVIQEKLGIAMSVLMGANIANEVADEKFCETTIGEIVTALSGIFCFGRGNAVSSF